MGPRDAVVAVGASAGGIPPLLEFVAHLPAALPVPVLVTVHIGERVHSKLPVVLDPTEATFDPMPRSVLAAVPTARVVPTGQLAEVVGELLGSAVGTGPAR